jgi:hypothetical protein
MDFDSGHVGLRSVPGLQIADNESVAHWMALLSITS